MKTSWLGSTNKIITSSQISLYIAKCIIGLKSTPSVSLSQLVTDLRPDKQLGHCCQIEINNISTLNIHYYILQYHSFSIDRICLFDTYVGKHSVQ